MCQGTIVFNRDRISSHLLAHGVTIEIYEREFGPPTDANNENRESTTEQQKEENPESQPQEKPNLVQQKILQSDNVVDNPPFKARKSAPSSTSAWRHPASGMFSYEPPYRMERDPHQG